MSEPTPPYTMADLGSAVRRSAPAAERNVTAIGDVLADWLPTRGLVLETSSGTGQHARAFAERFPNLDWQPSERDPDGLASIAAWRDGGPDNLLAPVEIDVANTTWPIERADATVSVNMAHIAPWEATLGLLAGAERILPQGGRLIFYGPWFEDGAEPAPSNLAFDESLRARDPKWGIRTVERLAAAAKRRGFTLAGKRAMPANNLMLLLEKRG